MFSGKFFPWYLTPDLICFRGSFTEWGVLFCFIFVASILRPNVDQTNGDELTKE